MTATALIEPPEHQYDSDGPLAGLAPLLASCPGGTTRLRCAGFGVVLLLLLVLRSRSSPRWSQSRSS